MARSDVGQPGDPWTKTEEEIIEKHVDEEMMKRRADEIQREIDRRVNEKLNNRQR